MSTTLLDEIEQHPIYRQPSTYKVWLTLRKMAKPLPNGATDVQQVQCQTITGMAWQAGVSRRTFYRALNILKEQDWLLISRLPGYPSTYCLNLRKDVLWEQQIREAMDRLEAAMANLERVVDGSGA